MVFFRVRDLFDVVSVVVALQKLPFGSHWQVRSTLMSWLVFISTLAQGDEVKRWKDKGENNNSSKVKWKMCNKSKSRNNKK